MPTLSIKVWIELISVLVLIAGILAWDHHERSIGRADILAEDAKIARQMQGKLDAAHKDAHDLQQTIDAYLAAHPVGPVYLRSVIVREPAGCREPAATPGVDAERPGPVVVPPVPPGSSGEVADSGPELDTLMRAAARLAVLVGEFQHD